MSAQTPPDTCPICGAGPKSSYTGDDYRSYQCGLIWCVDDAAPDNWFGACRFAMTAALRCGATLHPTDREAARETLVAAELRYYKLVKAHPWGQRDEAMQEKIEHASVDVADCAAAYLATVTP